MNAAFHWLIEHVLSSFTRGTSNSLMVLSGHIYEAVIFAVRSTYCPVIKRAVG